MAGKTILILGGGIGGQVAANLLRRKIARDHRVILIDRKGGYVFSPSLLWLIVGKRKLDQISRSLESLTQKGIEVVQAEVTRIDTSARAVLAGGRTFSYDYLIISLGADLAPETVPGLRTAHLFYEPSGAERLWKTARAFSGGRVAILIAATPFKCPAAPYEAAMLLNDYWRKLGLKKKFEISIYTPEPLPMPVAGPVVGNAVKEMVEGREIGFHPMMKIASVDAKTNELLFENGRRVGYDLLIAIPPHRAPQVIRDSGLAGESGWIPVDPSTLKTRYEGVYAIGDTTTIMLPVGKPLPKAGVFAHHQAEVVAKNIAAEIVGDKASEVFDGEGYCFLEMGAGRAGFAGGNFYTAPEPLIKLRKPGYHWHLGKVLFERWWLKHWF
ncbi:MAG: NAD(P)/FAD-dependent oxidoreductase [Candidatus Manganitrophaceae bacterium]|nr:MAG: NAD(P)/FAD-dependent oxidoreductase [Candidatus Manganitrophaceae bacterium]